MSRCICFCWGRAAEVVHNNKWTSLAPVSWVRANTLPTWHRQVGQGIKPRASRRHRHGSCGAEAASRSQNGALVAGHDPARSGSGLCAAHGCGERSTSQYAHLCVNFMCAWRRRFGVSLPFLAVACLFCCLVHSSPTLTRAAPWPTWWRSSRGFMRWDGCRDAASCDDQRHGHCVA